MYEIMYLNLKWLFEYLFSIYYDNFLKPIY